jgi:hypothetical protein
MYADECGGVTFGIVPIEGKAVVLRNLPTQQVPVGGKVRVLIHTSRYGRFPDRPASCFPRSLALHTFRRKGHSRALHARFGGWVYLREHAGLAERSGGRAPEVGPSISFTGCASITARNRRRSVALSGLLNAPSGTTRSVAAAPDGPCAQLQPGSSPSPALETPPGFPSRL